MTSPRLLRNVLIEIWRGDASVRSTSDGRLKRCGSFLAELREEVPANTFVWIKMELDEFGCGDHCETSTNKIYAPMKIGLFEARKRICLWEGHWHLKLGATTGRASGSPGRVAPWVGLEALMNQALSWLDGWEGRGEEEEAVVTWLYRAEEVMRKQDELWLRHILDVLLVELRKQPESSALRLTQTLSDIEGNNLIAEGHSDVVVSLLRAIMADEENADDAATAFAHVVKMLVSGDVATQARWVVGISQGWVPTTSAGLARVVALLRDHLEHLVTVEPSRFTIELRTDLLVWIRSASSVVDHGQLGNTLAELFALLRRWPVTGAFLLGTGFLRSIESDSDRHRSQQKLDNLARERDDSGTSEAVQEMYRALHQLHLRRLRAGPVSDEERIFLYTLYGALWPNGEQVVIELLGARAVVAAALVSDFTDVDQRLVPDSVNESSDIERHIFRHDWVDGKSREIAHLLSKHNDGSPPAADLGHVPERQSNQLHREPDPMILSLVPGERDWAIPEARR
jgi:hypothetical protein